LLLLLQQVGLVLRVPHHPPYQEGTVCHLILFCLKPSFDHTHFVVLVVLV
jgi:hypothetical protein